MRKMAMPCDLPGYHDFHRVKDVDGNKGFRYILNKPLTDERRNQLYAFSNVRISSCVHKYAPEIRYDTVILLDKCLH